MQATTSSSSPAYAVSAAMHQGQHLVMMTSQQQQQPHPAAQAMASSMVYTTYPLNLAGTPNNPMPVYGNELQHLNPQPVTVDPILQGMMLYDDRSGSSSVPVVSQAGESSHSMGLSTSNDHPMPAAFESQPAAQYPNPLMATYAHMPSTSYNTSQNNETSKDAYTRSLEKQLEEKTLTEQAYQIRIQSLMDLVSRQTAKINELRSELQAARAYASSVDSTRISSLGDE